MTLMTGWSPLSHFPTPTQTVSANKRVSVKDSDLFGMM